MPKAKVPIAISMDITLIFPRYINGSTLPIRKNTKVSKMNNDDNIGQNRKWALTPFSILPIQYLIIQMEPRINPINPKIPHINEMAI